MVFNVLKGNGVTTINYKIPTGRQFIIPIKAIRGEGIIMDIKKIMTKRELKTYRLLHYMGGAFLGIGLGIFISRHIGWESPWKFGFFIIGIILILVNVFLFENKFQRLVGELE